MGMMEGRKLIFYVVSFMLYRSHRWARPLAMPDPDRLTPAAPEHLADALAFALRYSGRKRTHDAGEMMAAIVAKRLVEHLESSGFVVMKKPPIGGGAALGRGADGR